MPKVFDCTLFFNELDLLEIRLHELAPVVDRFVIAEANTTFSGLPKALHYAENSGRFSAFADRITHVVVDTAALGEVGSWERRRRQCEGLLRGLADAAADDVVILSDVDEIVMAPAVAAVRARPPKAWEVLCFELRMSNFFVNLECHVKWLRSGPRAARRADIGSMEGLRRVRGPASGARDVFRALKAWREMGHPIRRRVIRDAGWHFSYLGGLDAVRQKLDSFAAHDHLPEGTKDPEVIAARMSGARSISFPGHDLLFRDLDGSFPAYLRGHRDRFAHLIADASRYPEIVRN